MIQGTKTVNRPPTEVLDRLGTVLAGANCEIIERSERFLRFRHGTHLTQTAPMLPKEGSIRLRRSPEGPGEATVVEYSVAVTGFARVWLALVAVVFFWAIFPPILAWRALVHHPRQLMENLLAGVV
jgi:hypothetical protein